MQWVVWWVRVCVCVCVYSYNSPELDFLINLTVSSCTVWQCAYTHGCEN